MCRGSSWFVPKRLRNCATVTRRRRFVPQPSEVSRMRKSVFCWIAVVAFLASTGLASPSHAISGSVRVSIAKAGLVVGAGAGRGTLSFRHRNYRFTVRGLSFGVTAGASINKLVGRADYMNELGD